MGNAGNNAQSSQYAIRIIYMLYTYITLYFQSTAWFFSLKKLHLNSLPPV